MASSTITVLEQTEWVIVQYCTDESTLIRKVVRFNEIEEFNMNQQPEAATPSDGSAQQYKHVFIKDDGISFIGNVIYKTVDEQYAKIRHKSHEFICMRMLGSLEDLLVDMESLNTIWLLIMCSSSEEGGPDGYKTVFKMLQKEKVHLENGKNSDHLFARFEENHSMRRGIVIAASCKQSDVKNMMDIIKDDLVQLCEADLIDTKEKNMQLSREIAEEERVMHDQWETLEEALQIMSYRKSTAAQLLNWLLALAEVNNLEINLSDFKGRN